MAYLSDEEIKKIWESIHIEALTEYTITDFKEFMKEINEIRKVGYAMDREENELGVKCLGSAILDYTKRPVAAMSVSGPVQRMTDEKVSVLVRNILEIKKLVSKELGCYL